MSDVGWVPRVLITGAGGPAGVALGEQLAGSPGLATWVGADIVQIADPNYSESVVVPRADDMGYAAGMLDCFITAAPHLVIPTVADELPQLAILADTFDWRRPRPDDGPAVLISSPVGTAIAADKLLTMLALDRAGVPVPGYAPATDFAAAAEAIDFAGGAVIVKPRVSRGGRGVQLVEDAEVFDWGATTAAEIVQGFAPGTEYCPQVYRSLTGETTVVLLEKTELKQGRVGNAAAVVRRELSQAPAVVEVAKAAVAALDLVGPIDLDIRLDQKESPVVLEVNARFGANSSRAPEMLRLALDEWLPN